MSAGDLDVAIAGATGVVGHELLRVLADRAFPVGRLRLLASARSRGSTLSFAGRDHPVACLEDEGFEGCDVAFFSAGAEASRVHAPRAAGAGALVVDNSSAFRMDADVPLVVPQVNGESVRGMRSGIIANPNCSTILLVMILAPLERRVRIRRIVCSTYQAVSGSGASAVAELESQAAASAEGRDLVCAVFPKPIHGNVLPFVQGFDEGDMTTEEWKMVRETRRILDRPDLRVTATCARVPVHRAHSEAVNLEFERPVDPADARRWLREAPGVAVLDDPAGCVFPTPRDADGRDEVMVGRIRVDPSHECGLDLWLTGDQLRKGAALNAVEVAEQALGLGSFAGGEPDGTLREP